MFLAAAVGEADQQEQGAIDGANKDLVPFPSGTCGQGGLVLGSLARKEMLVLLSGSCLEEPLKVPGRTMASWNGTSRLPEPGSRGTFGSPFGRMHQNAHGRHRSAGSILGEYW